MQSPFEIWSAEKICQALSGKLPKRQTLSGEFKKAQTVSAKSETPLRQLSLSELAHAFTLPWSAYVRLLSVKDAYARQFYEVEALRGGWSVRQLDRQIGSQFYERTALCKNKATMLTKGTIAKPEDTVTRRRCCQRPICAQVSESERRIFRS